MRYTTLQGIYLNRDGLNVHNKCNNESTIVQTIQLKLFVVYFIYKSPVINSITS